MKKFYPAFAGRLCLTLIASCLLCTFVRAQVVTYDTTFDGWNAIVTEDRSLSGHDSAAGIIFFPGIGEQTKNISDLQINGPHYLIKNKIWDGSVTLGNGVHHPFIISLQPPTSGYPASVVKPKIDAILKRYRIKRNSLFFTALSLGSWQANEFVTYEPTPGDHTYGRMVRAMVNLEGVEPADNTGIYVSKAYPNKMGSWAKTCGGRQLWVEGANDWRDMASGAQNMNDSVAGSATYFQVKYGGGAHCCWNTEYDPSVMWSKAKNSNINIQTGKDVPMNVWQWLLRQGDTTMPSGSKAPAVVAPTADAGSGQAITLPTSSVNLAGTGATYNGAKVNSMTWSQISGPNNSKIKSGNLVTAVMNTVANIIGALTGTSANLNATASGLIAGSYTFQLTVKDNNGLVSTSALTVSVKAAAPATPPPAAPNVSAGPSPTIALPNTTATLSGSAAGSNGAKIASVSWQQTAGPASATIVSPSSLSTKVTLLKAAGTYIFRMTVADKNGKQAASVVNVVVTPAPAASAPVQAALSVNAGAAQTITLPNTTVTLNGSAAGSNGSKIKSVLWQQSAGPVAATIANQASLSTKITLLKAAGTYIFRMTVTDQTGKQGASVVNVVVKAAPVAATPAPPAPPPSPTPNVSAGAAQTIELPNTTATLNGSATGSNGSKIKSVLWQQSSGPTAATIANPANLATKVTLLKAAGTYVFRVTVTDQNGKQSASVVNVVVLSAAVAANPAPPAPPAPPATAKVAPTVSAGPNQTVTLPATTATLNGSAKGNNGAVVNSWFWVFVSGPSFVKFGNEWAVTTTVSGLVAGTYVFELMASDNNYQTSASTMTVVVKPKAGAAQAGTTAMTSDAAAVTDESALDSANHAGGLVIYPNPVHDLLNIHLNNDINGKVIVAIFNTKGVRLQNQEFNKESFSLQTSIDVSRLAAGVYVIEAISGPGVRTIEKFIKQ